RAEPRELAHRPEPAAVHRGLHAARVRELPGEPEVARGVEARQIVRRVEGLDELIRERREAPFALGAPRDRRPVDLLEPPPLRVDFRWMRKGQSPLRPGPLQRRHAANRERAMTRRWISLVPS